MAITGYGYQKILETMKDSLVQFIELQDVNDNQIIIMSIGGGSIVIDGPVEHAENKVSYTVTVTGAEIGTGVTISKYRLLDAMPGSGGTIDAGTLDFPVTFNTATDSAEITINVVSPL